MRFFHLSDLHIGRQLHTYSLKENQRAILAQITDRVREYRPDAVLICGDVFDKSMPSGEAYDLFDEFLNGLSSIEPEIPVLIIAGNHDSPQRLGYAGSFLEKQGIHIAALPPAGEQERLKRVTLWDAWGPVDFFLMPFVKPGYVRHLFPVVQGLTYEGAVRGLLERESPDKSRRNVLLSHQFYVNGEALPQVCDSEQASFQVGGLDQVDVAAAEEFDYAAFGHIHGAQMVREPRFRYCGTPLKYSVSEEHHKKSITMVTLEEKGMKPRIEVIPLVPIQEVRRERGLLCEVLAQGTPENCHDFISVTLTDEGEPYRPKEQLEEVFDHILELRLDNGLTRDMLREPEASLEEALPLDRIKSFYEEMNGHPMSQEEEALIQGILLEEVGI